jgi:CubicO group peptidase (beta-lactamase class C family)
MRMDHIGTALDQVGATVKEMMQSWPMGGGIVTVVSRDAVLAERPFGFANIDARIPVRAEHLFQIGSISKIFTGLLTVQLADAGLIDLTAPVTRYLPWFSVQSQHPVLSIQHLLHHTSGLIKGADDPPDELAQCWGLREARTGSAPGALFHYSNLGYVLLGLVIQSVTGTPHAELCRARLLEPIGMTHTIPRITNADRPRLAVGYAPARDDQPWVPGDALAPAPWLEVNAADGNIASSGGDMGRFLRVLLGRGRIDGRDVASPSVFERMIGTLAVGGEEPVEILGDAGVQVSRYGLGINVETIRGNRCLTHGGGMVGYSTFIIADMDAGIGIAVLTNANGDCPAGQVIARLCHDLLRDPARGVPQADLVLRTSSRTFDPAMLGSFAGQDAGGHARAITICDEGGDVALNSGGRKKLYLTWSRRVATDHPDFRRFHLSFQHTSDGPAWTYGGTVMRPPAVKRAPKRETTEDPARAMRWQAAVGRYRSYSPWFPTFRIAQRGSRLFLIAPGGVEAPAEDLELVELAPGVFRLGHDAALPERLTLGPIVDGKVVTVLRDGCRYSRTVE